MVEGNLKPGVEQQLKQIERIFGGAKFDAGELNLNDL